MISGGDYAGAYSYDLFGMQITYSLDGTSVTYYTYRPDGLRHSIQGKAHAWDNGNIVADMGAETVYYIRALTLVYAKDGSTKTYYRFNGHGDVIALANASGAVIKRYKYDAFGVEENPDVFDTNVFRYCAEYYDIETKTVYLRARYYDAETGRFTQQDGGEYAEAGDALSLNLYVYCNNDPIKYADPSGHSFRLGVALGLIKGARKLVRALIKTYTVGGASWSYFVKETVGGIIEGFCDGVTFGRQSKFLKIVVKFVGGGIVGFVGSLAEKIEKKEDLRSSEVKEEILIDILLDALKGAADEIKGMGIDKLLSNMKEVNDWLLKVFEYIDERGLIDRKYIDRIVEFINCDLSDELKQRLEDLLSR